jgi:hypothetical protein
VSRSRAAGRKTRSILKVPAGEPPDVQSVSPSSGSIAGGTTVTITLGPEPYLGAYDGVAVRIGTTACTSAARVNATTVTAVTGAHTALLCPVYVTTAWGTGRKNALYTYVSAGDDGLLQESGDDLLLETGDRILLDEVA